MTYNVGHTVDDLRDRLTGSVAYLSKDLQDLIEYTDELEALNRFHPDSQDDRF